MEDPMRRDAEPMAANPNADWISVQTMELHASAESRLRPESDDQFVAKVGTRLRRYARILSQADSGAAGRMLERLKTATGEDREKCLSALRRIEASFDVFLSERRLVSDFLQHHSPQEVAAMLRSGIRHPRYLTEVATGQVANLRYGEPLVDPNEVILRFVPEGLRPAFSALTSERVPRECKKLAEVVANQLANRAYPQAVASLRELSAPWSNDDENLRGLSGRILEQERSEREREEALFALQAELYEMIAKAHPGRAPELARRRRTEEILRHGSPVGELVPLIPTQNHAGAPFKVTFEHEGETREAVVKFAFSERCSREGLTPGNGQWREVAGAVHALAFGLEAPAVVARRSAQFGDATIMELVDGQSCVQKNDWFLGSDGELRPELWAMAIDEYLKMRTDGAPRNIIETSDGRLVPVDHGSDLPSDPNTPVSSVALYLMRDSNQTVSHSLVAQILAFAESAELGIFRRMIALFPEDMSGYLTAYDERIGQLVRTYGVSSLEPYFPTYDTKRKDFGEKFHEDYAAYKASRKRLPDRRDADRDRAIE